MASIMNQITIMRRDLDLSERQLMEYSAMANEAFLLRAIGRAAETTDSEAAQNSIFCPIWIGKYTFFSLMDEHRERMIMAARDEKHLMMAVDLAKTVGMKEDEHYFVFKDKRDVPVCIGFTPTDPEVTAIISKSYLPY